MSKDIQNSEGTPDNTEATNEEANVESSQEGQTTEQSIDNALSDTNNDAPVEDVIPETYEFTTPEGYELSEGVTGIVTKLAKEMKLSATNAQSLVDTHLQVVALQEQERTQAWTEHLVKQEQACKQHAVLGGTNYAENIAIAEKAVQSVMSESALKSLSDYGMLKDPEVMAGFLKVGKAISEDSLVTGQRKSVAKDALDFSDIKDKL